MTARIFEGKLLAHNPILATQYLMDKVDQAQNMANKITHNMVPNTYKGRNNTVWVQGQLCANGICAVAYALWKNL